MALDPGGASGGSADEDDSDSGEETQTIEMPDTGGFTEDTTSRTTSRSGATTGTRDPSTRSDVGPTEDSTPTRTTDQESGDDSSAAERQLEDTDPGGGAGSDRPGTGETTRRDTTRRQETTDATTGSGGSTSPERTVAEGAVTSTLEEGVEGVESDPAQEQALAFQERLIEEDDRIDDASDVAIVREDGRLTAQFTRSAQVDRVARGLDLEGEVLAQIRRDERPTGRGLDPGQALSPMSQRIGRGDIDVDVQGGEIDVSVDERVVRETIRDRAAATSPDVDPEDVQVVEEGGEFRVHVPEEPTGRFEPDGDVEPGRVATAIAEGGRAFRRQKPGVDAALTVLGTSLRTEQGVELEGDLVDVRLPGQRDVGAATDRLDTAAEPIDRGIETAVETIGTPGRVAAGRLSSATGVSGFETVQQDIGQEGAETGLKLLNPARLGQDAVRNTDFALRGADAATRDGGAEAVQRGIDIGGAATRFAVEEGPDIARETAREEPERIGRGAVALGTAGVVGVGAGTAAFRGGGAATRGARRADVGDVTVPQVRRTGQAARDRAPNVAVRRDRDAPLIDVQGVEVSELGSRAATRVRNVPRSAQIAGMRARRDFDEFITDVRFEAGQARARAADAIPTRQTIRDVDPFAPARHGAQRAELAARRGRRDLDEFTTDVRFTAEQTATRARRAPRVAAERGRIRTERAIRDVDDFVTDVQFTATEGAARVRRAPRVAAERGRVARSRLERRIEDFQTDLSFELEQREFLQATETARVDPTQVGRTTGTPGFDFPSVPSLPGRGALPSRPSLPDAPDLPSSAFIDDVGTARIDPTQAGRGLERPSIPSLPSRPSRPRLDLPSPREFTIQIGQPRQRRVDIDADDLGEIDTATPAPRRFDEVDDASDAAPGSFESDVDVSGGAGQMTVARREQRPGVGTDATSRIDELPDTDAPTSSRGIVPPTAANIDVSAATGPSIDSDLAGTGLDDRDATLSIQEASSPTIAEEDIEGPTDGLDTTPGTVGSIDVAGQGEGVGVGEVPVVDTGTGARERQAAPPTSVTTPATKTPPGLQGRGAARGAPPGQGPPRVPLPDIDFPDADPTRRRRRRFDFFEREIIAPVDEDPLNSIDQALDGGGFDVEVPDL